LNKNLKITRFKANDLRVYHGTQTNSLGGLSKISGEDGESAAAIPVGSFLAADVPYIEIEFTHVPPKATAVLLWQSAGKAESFKRIILHDRSVYRLPMKWTVDWTGKIDFLAILVITQPGRSWGVKRVDLMPGGWASDIRSQFNDWHDFSPWALNSINLYRGTGFRHTTLPPIPLLAGWLLISLLVYYLITLFNHSKTGSSTAAYGLIVLVVWLVADGLWQLRLGARAWDTYNQFFHLSQAEKLEQTADSYLAEFAGRIKGKMAGNKNRIFVISKNKYLGMKTAYLLYPGNVYWDRFTSKLPNPKYIRKGDYIVLMAGGDTVFKPGTQTLNYGHRKKLPVQHLLDDASGTLFQVR